MQAIKPSRECSVAGYVPCARHPTSPVTLSSSGHCSHRLPAKVFFHPARMTNVGSQGNSVGANLRELLGPRDVCWWEPSMVPHCTPPGQQVPPMSPLPCIEPTTASSARAENSSPWHQLNFTWAIMTEPLDKLQEICVLNVPKNILMWCNADVQIWAGLRVFF